MQFLINANKKVLVTFRKHETIGSLCKESSLEKVSFLDEIYSGCFIELQKSNFLKCSELRQNVKSTLSNLISGEMIAKGGSLNTSSEEFVKIIFDDDDDFDEIQDPKGKRGRQR